MVRHRVSADEEESSSTRDSLLSSTAASLLYRQWRNEVVRYNCLLRTKQQSIWSSRVREADGNPRNLWKTLSNLLTPAAQPVHHFTAQDFSVTFKNKVDSIRASTAGAPGPTPPTASCQSQLDSYSLMTVADVKRLLGVLPNKQCSLDPVPTWLVKSLCNTMPIILINLINSSLLSGIFPSAVLGSKIGEEWCDVDPHNELVLSFGVVTFVSLWRKSIKKHGRESAHRQTEQADTRCDRDKLDL